MEKEKKEKIEIRLNLIPPQKREEIFKRNRIKKAVRLEIFLAVIFIFFTAVLWSFKYILDFSLASDASTNKAQEKQAQYESLKNHESRFKEINASISEVATLNKDQFYWSKLLTKFETIIVPGITVSALKTTDFSVSLSGLSATRDDLILMKSNMENDDCFQNIDLPLSNLVEKNNIEFKIFFDFKKECLKKQ